MTIEEWYAELCKVASSYGWANPQRQLGGVETWRDYFNEGYSPKDALDEDLSYA